MTHLPPFERKRILSSSTDLESIQLVNTSRVFLSFYIFFLQKYPCTIINWILPSSVELERILIPLERGSGP